MYVHCRGLVVLFCALSCQLSFGQGFRANGGQVRDEHGGRRPDVLFSCHLRDKTVHLRKGGFSYQFFAGHASEEQGATRYEVHRIDVDLVGASPDLTTEEGRSVAPARYYLPHAWGVRTELVDEVLYKEVHEGVDVRFAVQHGSFKYDVICRDAEAMARARIRYSGSTTPPVVGASGGVVIGTRFGEMVEHIPVSLLCKEGVCREVTVLVKPTLLPDEFEFELQGEWPEGSSLVIDPMPKQLWSTYTGGQGYDQTTRVAVDEQGHVWLAGHTDSFENIATSGAHQTELLGFQNCFLQQYTAEGELIQGTYFGGELAERCYALVLEPGTGNVYMGGGTFSPGLATPGAHQEQIASVDDALLLKFSPNGELLWSTYYGGPGHDLIAAMAMDADGDLVMTGHTRSPVGVATDQTTLEGIENVLVAKFTPDGQRVWGSYLGATVDEGWGIGVDSEGHVYVCGTTASFVNISTPGAHQMNNGGGRDAFLARYNPAGELLWSTYYGGAGDDACQALVVSGDGTVVILGSTASATGIATSDAAQMLPGSENDGFLARFTPAGERIWGTYLGGEQLEEFTAVVEEPDGGLLLCGWSQSLNGVTSPNAFQRYPAGEFDALLLRCNASGALEWGTYFGGPLSEYAYDLARDPASGHVVVIGITRSESGVSTPNAAYPDFLGGLYDGFMARFCVPPTPTIAALDGVVLCGPGPFHFVLDGVHDAVAWNVGGSGGALEWYPPAPGSYVLYADVIGQGGCPGTSDTLLVTVVADAFIPELMLVADPAGVVCTGTGILLSVEPTFTSTLWWNGSTGPSTSVVLSDTLPYVATITVFNAEGCAYRDSILLLAKDCTFIPQQGMDPPTPRLYPNPSKGRFFVEVSSPSVHPLHVAFLAMDGRLLRQYVIPEGAVLQPELGAGVYLVVFSGGGTGWRSTQMVELLE